MKALFLAGVVLTGAALVTGEGPAGRLPNYGVGDQAGAANNMKPAIVRAAAGLVREGRVYSLAIDTGDPRLNGKPFAGRDYAMHVEQLHPPGATVHDDRLTIWMGVYGTSIDGLGHVGRGDRFYNGFKAEDIFAESGLRRLGIENVPPIVTWGVLLDFPAYYGVDRLPPEKRIDRADIQAVAKWAHVAIHKGDVVLIHTGWQQYLLADPARFAHQPGLGLDGARYLGEMGVSRSGPTITVSRPFRKSMRKGVRCPSTRCCSPITASIFWRTCGRTNWRATAPMNSCSFSARRS